MVNNIVFLIASNNGKKKSNLKLIKLGDVEILIGSSITLIDNMFSPVLLMLVLQCTKMQSCTKTYR